MTDATPEMLLFGHSMIMATLDFLMVAQCASLMHKVVVGGWELLQFPWVRSYTVHNQDGKMDGAGALTVNVDRLSSLGSDSTSSQSTGTDSSSYYQRYYIQWSILLKPLEAATVSLFGG